MLFITEYFKALFYLGDRNSIHWAFKKNRTVANIISVSYIVIYSSRLLKESQDIVLLRSRSIKTYDKWKEMYSYDLISNISPSGNQRQQQIIKKFWKQNQENYL